MANVTITQLPAAGPITGTELVPVVQNGVTVQTTTGALAGAPVQSQTFLTLNQESTLPNSRYLSVGTGLGLTDGGAQSTYQLALTGAGLSLLTSPTGLQVKTGPNTVGAVQIAVGNGLSITNASGATGNPTISLATGIMSNLAATTGTGFLAVNGATVTPVSLQPVANQTAVYDPSAAAGVPAVGLADNPVVPGTASITVPIGTTAQRAAVPAAGMFRFDTTTGFFEGYDGVIWRPFSVGGAAVTSFSANGTGLTPNTASTGIVTLGGILNTASGGTGAVSLTGYLFGNGASPATASTTIPTTALSGQITNAQLVNPSLTVNGSLVALGGATTVAAATPNALTAGTGLSGGSFTGAAAATFALANTTVTAGSYGSAANTTPFTVDAQGRLTAAASTPIAILSQQITDKGAANGVASLDATGAVPLSQLPASIAGAVSYQGGWNASTNVPTLSSGIGTKGYYYIVATAGTTTLNGINLWSVGDWAVFDGTAWEKVNGSSSEAFSNITLTALTGLLYGNSTSPLTVATGAQVLSGLSTALGTGVATSLGQIVNTANGFVTQSGADGRYAALAGLSTQVFNVATATTSTEAVPLGQAQSDFAPISGSAVYVSSAALAASGGAALIGTADSSTLQSLLTNSLGHVVTSISALRAVSKIDYTETFVTGYYASGDGGGGPYYYDAADTTSADNGGTIIVAADNGRWKLSTTTKINVRQFGAKGDGVTDDTVAIQAALTYCYSVNQDLFLQTGTYLISAQLVNKGVSMIGEGRFYSQFLLATTFPAATDILLIQPDSGAYIDFLELGRFSVQPTNGGIKYGGTAIYMNFQVATNLSKLHMHDLYLLPGNDYSFQINNNTAVNIQGVPADSTIERCYFAEGTKLIGIGDSNNIEENIFRASGGNRTAIWVYMSDTSGVASHTVIRQNNIDCPGGALYAVRGRNIKFIYNNVELSAGPGTLNGAVIDMDGSSGGIPWPEVCSNHVGIFGTATASSAVRVNGAQACKVDQNTLLAGITVSDAISITASALDTVVGWNEIQSNYTTPVADSGLRTIGTTSSAVLLNGFTNSGSYQPLSFIKHRDGSVTVTGVVAAPVNPSGVIIATLPLGYRPVALQRCACGAVVSGSASPQALEVGTSGNIVYYGSNSATRVEINITFPTLNYVIGSL